MSSTLRRSVEAAFPKPKATRKRKRKRMNTRFRKAVEAAFAATDGIKMKVCVPKAMEERLAATIANPESETATHLLQTLEKRNLDGFEFSYSSEDEWESEDDTTAA
jgi:hypothetical protein